MKWQILISVLLGVATAGVGAMVAWEMSFHQQDVANGITPRPERNAPQLPSTPPPEIAPLKPDADELYPVEGTPYLARWKSIDDFELPLAVFDTVFWEPQDTISLRGLIRETRLVHGKTVLEIGTGSGLVALCCLQAGADRVVATDINPAAVACARFNARRLERPERFEVRQVSESDSGAFAVIRPGERFDLIISNPPWEDEAPKTIGEYALYDRRFALMKSLVAGLRQHLAPGGKALLAYGSVTAVRTLFNVCDAENLYVRLLDERDLDALPEVFLPGMLVEVRTDEKVTDPAPRTKGNF
jgi:release factor glutamine methyltransferase